MKRYDFILAGGGIAGLSLAYHLTQIARDAQNAPSILIVDKDDKTRNDRTLCFWTNEATPFDDIVFRSWDQIQFVGENFQGNIDLRPYRYVMIRAVDFYNFVRDSTQVNFLRGSVDAICDASDGATISVDGATYEASWVFDSRFKRSDFHPDYARYHILQQHFEGWEIDFSGGPPGKASTIFDPRTATLFDFRTPQNGELRFFYVLPLSDRRALIEFVSLSRNNCDHAVADYIDSVLGIKEYQVLAREGGVSPLTDYPFPRRAGKHVMNIGILGGRIKPTSGYAFQRIQKDSGAIVRSLETQGHPFAVAPDPGFYRLCDSLMLHVMLNHGDRMKPIFSDLFRNNPVTRVFRFLDEKTTPWEVFRVMASLPPWIFLQALFEYKGEGKTNLHELLT